MDHRLGCKSFVLGFWWLCVFWCAFWCRRSFGTCKLYMRLRNFLVCLGHFGDLRIWDHAWIRLFLLIIFLSVHFTPVGFYKLVRDRRDVSDYWLAYGLAQSVTEHYSVKILRLQCLVVLFKYTRELEFYGLRQVPSRLVNQILLSFLKVFKGFLQVELHVHLEKFASWVSLFLLATFDELSESLCVD